MDETEGKDIPIKDRLQEAIKGRVGVFFQGVELNRVGDTVTCGGAVSVEVRKFGRETVATAAVNGFSVAKLSSETGKNWVKTWTVIAFGQALGQSVELVLTEKQGENTIKVSLPGTSTSNFRSGLSSDELNNENWADLVSLYGLV